MTKKINLQKLDQAKLERLAGKLRMVCNGVETDIRYIPETGETCLICRRPENNLTEIVKFAISRGLETKFILDEGMYAIKLYTP